MDNEPNEQEAGWGRSYLSSASALTPEDLDRAMQTMQDNAVVSNRPQTTFYSDLVRENIAIDDGSVFTNDSEILIEDMTNLRAENIRRVGSITQDVDFSGWTVIMGDGNSCEIQHVDGRCIAIKKCGEDAS